MRRKSRCQPDRARPLPCNGQTRNRRARNQCNRRHFSATRSRTSGSTPDLHQSSWPRPGPMDNTSPIIATVFAASSFCCHQVVQGEPHLYQSLPFRLYCLKSQLARKEIGSRPVIGPGEFCGNDFGFSLCPISCRVAGSVVYYSRRPGDPTVKGINASHPPSHFEMNTFFRSCRAHDLATDFC